MSKDLTQNLNGSQDEKLDRIIAAFERMEVDLHDVKARLARLETTVEERLRDTRPMWETVQGQLTELRTDLSELRTDLSELRIEFKADLQELRTEFKADLEKLRNETEKGFRRLGHTIDLYNRTVQELHADVRDQEERLDKLEKIES